ncbi:MAG: 16S rRNA (cytidine(1402)-2'-O)-methyltransferase [Clostridia bacterium]|nr:16S rRNA (cytidine(1402)-2'-O)-methyltransferase [Clostridia bacterium]
MGGTLYLVATPIGNLADLSERAVKVLSEVDFIAAEDTRNSVRLLTYLDIRKPMVAYHEHNRAEAGEAIVRRLLAGESCALITDAGTPAISDPGEDLVALCAQRGVPVTSIPGCCAAIVALTLSGLPTRRFVFEGFLSAVAKDRRERLRALESEERTVIFHEAPHKLKKTLSDMLDIFGGERRISLCRELTKLNEDVFRTDLSGAVSFYSEHEPRGEYVLVLEGCAEAQKAENDRRLLSLSVTEHVDVYIGQGLDKKEAMKAAARDRGVTKSDIYREYVTNGEK